MALSRAQVRSIDRRAIQEYGLSGLVLMENAGRGCVDVLCRLACRGPVAIVCGKGNNAGDGLVMARHLDLRGIAVKVLLFGPPAELHGDAAVNYAIVVKSGIPLIDLSGPWDASRFDAELAGAEWIVDALLGTGATGAPRPPWDEAIRRLNSQTCRKLAVDLPSGLECDTGLASDPTVRADHTCTFVARKIGFENPAAPEFLGVVHVLDIGAPRRLVAEIQSARS
ncbi:MAG: NAD(P)H-hydrate epimerase [Planctomycetaceae bacterium]|nr:NAD(P)H-hydrate epimerase [Planctomycetaceae bacterium]